MKWYITGDTHGKNEERLKQFEKNEDQIALIILGDSGVNFYLNKSDHNRKKRLLEMGINLYLVRGNHEERPENLPNITMIWDENVEGNVYVEPEFPNIKYFLDGASYVIDGLKVLVIGGAYSVDKYWRLGNLPEDTDIWTGWFKDEQLTAKEKTAILIATSGEEYDLVLTHTCPYSWMPRDLFLNVVDQSTVDNSMEQFLEVIKDHVKWKAWLFGHFHADRLEFPRVEQYYTDIESLSNIKRRWLEGEPNVEWWLRKGPNYYMEANK